MCTTSAPPRVFPGPGLALQRFHYPCDALRPHLPRQPLSVASAAQLADIREVDDQVWQVSFLEYDLGYFDHDRDRVEPGSNPFVPDTAPMCPECTRRQLLPVTFHETGRYANSRAALSQQATRAGERGMRPFSSPAQAQRFLSADAVVYNLFNLQRHLVSGGSTVSVGRARANIGTTRLQL